MFDSALEVIEGRASTHGDYSLGSRVAMKMFDIFEDYQIQEMSTEQRYAMFMFFAKISRIATGDPNDVDHWRDIAGYATLVQKHLEKNGCKDNGK